MCGNWSTDVALNRLRVFSSRTTVGMCVIAPTLCTFGLPR
jgi:hypothetical protein